MSEQRFRANFDVSIYDSEKEEYISVSERGLEEIAKRMNEQQDKITELEIELTDCKNRKEQSEYNLRRENGQLRQILKDIIGTTDETYTKNASMFKVTVVLDYEKYMEIRRCIE